MKAGPIWDVPIYEEFFREVRSVTTGLPKDRQLRILVRIHRSNGNTSTPRRTGSLGTAVAMCMWRIWSEPRRCGDIVGRCWCSAMVTTFGRWKDAFDGDMKPMHARRNRIERDDPESVFSISTNTTAPLELLEHRVSSWPVPRLVVMRGTMLFGGLT